MTPPVPRSDGLRGGRPRSLVRGLLDGVAKAASGVASRHPRLLPTLPRLPRRVRLRLPDLLEPHGATLPTVRTRRHGARFELDLTDAVQRAVFLDVYESEEIALLRKLVGPGAVCLDVGANVGLFSCVLGLLVGAEGRVHAFEPEPRNVARLRRNVTLNGLDGVVEIHEAAVSDEAGTVTFHRHDAAHSGWGGLEPHPDHVARLERRAVTVDDVLDERDIDRVRLLKVDVEGAETRVLDGAARALASRRIDYVLVEHNGFWLARRGRDPRALFARMDGAGYEPARLNLDRVEAIRRGSGPADAVVNVLFRRVGGGGRAVPSR